MRPRGFEPLTFGIGILGFFTTVRLDAPNFLILRLLLAHRDEPRRTDLQHGYSKITTLGSGLHRKLFISLNLE